jgi:AcrR family transcriptional regulator
VGRKRLAEPVRTKQDRHGIRERLLRAGAELFAEGGMQKALVADVAKRADVSVGAFYRYFRDKDELYREIVQARFDEYLGTLRGLLDGLRTDSLRERLDVLRSVFRRTFETHLADPSTFLLWYQHGHGVSDAVDAIVAEFVHEVESLLIAVLDRTITVGDQYDEPTRRLVAASMLGMANTIAYRMISERESNVEHATEVCTRIVAGGLFALAPPEWQASLLALYREEILRSNVEVVGHEHASDTPHDPDRA